MEYMNLVSEIHHTLPRKTFQNVETKVSKREDLENGKRMVSGETHALCTSAKDVDAFVQRVKVL